MPQKNPTERARKAKARGVTMSVKRSDVSDTGPKSNHANKKSRGLLRFRSFSDRTVSPGAAPNEGRSARGEELPLPDRPGSTSNHKKTVPDAAAKRFRKSGERKMRSNDNRIEPGTDLRGRSKKPSRLHVKAKGGPFKRSRLHGG